MKYLLRTTAVIAVLFAIASWTPAQHAALTCNVSVSDSNLDKSEKLGEFAVEGKGENLVVKSFSFPYSGLFITTGVQFLKKVASRPSTIPDEVYLLLFLGRKRFSLDSAYLRNRDVITNAQSLFELSGFKSGNVDTIFYGKAEPVVISLECAKKSP